MQESVFQPEDDQPIRLDEAAVDDWASQLPLTNVSYSGKALLAALRHLNQSTLASCNERFRLAERLRPAVVLLSQMGMAGDLANLAFPLGPACRRAINRSFLLVLELARAYRQVINSPDFWSEWSMNEHLRAVVIYRSLEAYGLALLRAEEGYQAPPPGFWHSIHSLYRCAEDRELQWERVRGVGAEQTGSNIRDVFLQICLFALADCHGHRPVEIRSIFQILGGLARKTELNDASSPRARQSRFYVDLESDWAPVRLMPGELPEGDVRFLMTQGLLENAESHLASFRARAMDGIRVERGLFKKVLRSIAKPAPRLAQRFSGGATVSLVIGLDRLIDEMSVGATVVEQRPNLPLRASEGMSRDGISELTVEEIPAEQWFDDPLLRSSDERPPRSMPGKKGGALAVSEPDSASGNGRSGGTKHRFRAATVNFSAGGHCLRWESRQAGFLKVGELVGLPTAEQTWNIGVIRWLRHGEGDELKFGIELIVPEAYPVSVALAGFPESRIPGLFAPPNLRLGLGAGLLIKPTRFRAGHLLSVESALAGQKYLVDRSVESTPSYQHLALTSEGVGTPLFC